MFGAPDLSRRRRSPELMDEPGLHPDEHRRALVALARVNRMSRVAGSLWAHIAPLARGSGRPLRILDLACGGGDVALGLARLAARADVPIALAGCDLSPLAVEHASAAAHRARAAVRFFPCDLLADPFPAGYHVLVSSLFLHHLDSSEAETLLRRVASSGATLALFSDLRRTRRGYALASGVPKLLSRSRVAHADGPLSVQAAFTRSEILDLARKAGLEGASAEKIWPERFLLRWRRPQERSNDSSSLEGKRFG